MDPKGNCPSGIEQKETTSIGIVDGRDMERTRCSKTQTLSMSMANKPGNGIWYAPFRNWILVPIQGGERSEVGRIAARCCGLGGLKVVCREVEVEEIEFLSGVRPALS